MRILLALLAPLALGFFGVSLLGPKESGKAASGLLKASLSVGVGFGLLSFLLLFWLFAKGYWSGGFFGLLAGSLAVSALFYFKARAARVPLTAASQVPDREIRQILLPYFYFALALAVAVSIFYFLKNPHGNWDAWSHWNLRARFVFWGGSAWSNALHPDYWNPLNYPLFLPLAVAAGWGLAGQETAWVPGAIAMLFTLGTIALLSSTLSRLRSPGQGMLAAILLVGTPYFLTHGNSQYSDIPLGFFFLASFALATLYDLEPERSPRFLLLAGVMAGLSAWTKNEGLLFIACFALVRLAYYFFAEGWRAAWRWLSWFCLGLLPVLAIVAYVKTQLYTPETIFQTRGVPYTAQRFSDWSRYQKIATNFLRTFFSFGQWILSLPLILALYLFWIKIQPSRIARRAGGMVFLTLLLILGGYFLVFLATPHNLDWHLRTSVDRLFLVLFPSFLFGFFLIARSPEEALAQATEPSSNFLSDKSVSSEKIG